MTLDTLSRLDVHIPVTPFLIFLIFAVIMAAWAVFSWILRYHWKSYGTSKLEVMTMSLVYFVGSGILLASMALFAFLYHISAT